MKRILFSILTIAVFQLPVMAQINRSKAPEPGPAPIIYIPEAASFELPNGLKVFVVSNSKLPQVSATLTIDRLAIQEDNKAGVAELTGALMRYGTSKMKKSQLDEAIDFLGGNVNTSALSASASSLTKNFPEVLGLMADVVLRPSFPADQLENIRKQMLSGIESQKDDPGAIASNLTSVLLYGKNHPYGEIQTEATVKSITGADVKKFYTSLWKPNIAYLVFVGDINPAKAKELATRYFGSWQKGPVPPENYPAVTPPAKNIVAIVDRPSSVQSTIRIVTPANLKPGTANAIPASLMNSILGGHVLDSRLNQNLREKYGFTYGAYSNLTADRLVGSFLASAEVRNEKTDSAIAQLLYEINRMATEVPSETDVNFMKNYINGGFARSLESPSTIAAFALNTAIYRLPKDYYRNYLTTLNSVTPATINKLGNEYLAGPKIIAIVGNAREIAPGLEKYGEVMYFDMYGNRVEAPVTKTVDAAVKPEDILRKAIAAYGGEEALSKIKDIEMRGKVSVMGQELDYVQKNILPSSFSAKVEMGGMALMNQSKKGDNYNMSMQGNDVPLDADSKEEMNARASLFEEKYYLNAPGYSFKLKGIEPVDGKDAYVLAITSPDGSTSTSYYDVNSGLKVQQLSERDGGPMGRVNIKASFAEYKTFEGLKLPVKILNDFGQFQQSITISSVKINQGLKEADL